MGAALLVVIYLLGSAGIAGLLEWRAVSARAGGNPNATYEDYWPMGFGLWVLWSLVGVPLIAFAIF